MAQSIHIHRFENGLVLIAESMEWLESAAFNIFLPSGCERDPGDLVGLSNFTCEMVQRGCGSRDSRRFMEDLEMLGASHGGSVGNTTTSFGATMPAVNLHEVLTIYADLVRQPHLPEQQLEDGRSACLQEIWALEDDLAQRMMNELRERQYPTPFGRSPLGTVDSVQRIKLSDIREHFAATYRPHEAIIAVAGKIDWPRLRGHIDRLFGDWQTHSLSPVETSPAERGYRHLEYASQQTQIGVAFSSVPYADPDYFQARGAVGVLSDGMSSRLFTEVREKRGLCYSVYAMCNSLRTEGSVFCYAGTSTDRAQETLDVLVSELVRLREGILPAELDRLKVQVRSRLVMEQESSRSRAAALALDWYFLGRVRTLDELSDIIHRLSVESINRYLGANPPQNFCIVTLGERPLRVPVAALGGKAAKR